MDYYAPAPTARRRTLLGAIVALLLGLVSSGCSAAPSESSATTAPSAISSSTTAGSDGSTAGTVDTSTQGVRFAECMRANGVSDFPDPDASGDFVYGVSVSPEEWQAALDACHDLQPPGTLSADRSPEQQSAGLAFAECIRANGVSDFPDPVAGEPLVNTYNIPSTASADGMAILNAAMETCREFQADAAGSDQ